MWTLSGRLIPWMLAVLCTLPVAAAAGSIQKVSASPSTLVAGNTATILVEGSGSCSRIELSFGDGAKTTLAGKLATLPAPTLSASHPYPAPGTFTVTARAASSDCSGGTKSVSLKVVPLPPPGTKGPYSGLPGALRGGEVGPGALTASLAQLTGLAVRSLQTELAEVGSPVVIRLEGTGSTVCQGIVLDFGDGTKPLTLNGTFPFESPPHVYTKVQPYTVRAKGPGGTCLGQASTTFTPHRPGFSRLAASAPTASTVAQAMAPRITTVIALAVQPGGGVMIKGERFGSERPTVQLVGNFPGSPIRVVVDQWGDTFAAGVFPAGVSAVVDHAVQLEVVRARDGWPSNRWPLISPTTAGEIVTIPLPMDAGRVLLCSRAGRGTPSCYIGGGGINGLHTASYGAGGLFADTTGTDEFEIDLKNGWVIAAHRAQGVQKGLDGAVEGLDAAVNSSYARLKVRWFAPNPQGGDQASYSIAIWIRGPKNEPYR